MKSAPPSASAPSRNATRIATVVAPNRNAEREREENGAHRLPDEHGPAREPAQRRRGCGLRDEDRRHHHRAAQPSRPAEDLVREEHSGERGERRFEREHERGACSRRPSLHPRGDEVAERTGEDAGHEESAPDRRSARHLQVAERKRDDGEADERRRHLQERQRPRVVARREALHRRDLECLEHGVREDERVAERGSARHAAQEQEPDHGQHDAGPERTRHRRAEQGERKERREHDVEAGDEAGARNGRELEPGRLEPIRSRQQCADADSGGVPGSRECAQRAPGERGEDDRRDRKPHREEGEQGIQLDRVLDLDERDAPDRRDADECEKWSLPVQGPDSLRSFRMSVTDTLGRPVRDLRISVTDRCNFRCVYCMPKEVFGREYRFLPRRELLTFEEIEQVARVFVELGVQKLRITGGEPLLRRDLELLIARLAALGDDLDVTLTTNAALLAQKAQALADAGLSRITVSLDSLDDEVFRAMNDVDFPVARVLAGIDAAAEAGLPVKVNVVVKRGLNESSILDIARRFRGTGHAVRFIEFMDVGATNGWRMDDVVPAAEIVAAIGAEFPLEPVEAAYRGEVAERYRYLDGAGEIGVIASVTQPFCGDCTRARISADGKLYTCLFAVRGHDLRALLRSDSADELEETIRAVWTRRADRYSEIRTAGTSSLRKVEMSYIGG